MYCTCGYTRFWTIESPQETTHSLNSVIDVPTIAIASLLSPTLTTLAKAVSPGFLTTFPAFTIKQLFKYSPSSLATSMGHLNTKRSSTQSIAKQKSVTNTLANVLIIENIPYLLTNGSSNKTTLHESACISFQTVTSPQIDLNPNLILDDTLLHSPNYLSRIYSNLNIPTRQNA